MLAVRRSNHSRATFTALAHTLALQTMCTGLVDAIASSILRLVLGVNQEGLEGDGRS